MCLCASPNFHVCGMWMQELSEKMRARTFKNVNVHVMVSFIQIYVVPCTKKIHAGCRYICRKISKYIQKSKCSI